MAVEIVAENLEAVPEVLRPFVTENGGKFSLDETRIKTEQDVENVLEAKRKETNDRKAAEDALRPFKQLGKSPEELAELLRSAANGNPAGSDPTKSAEYLTLAKQLEDLKNAYEPMKADYEREKAEKAKRETWDAVEKMIDKLDDKYDRELVREWAKDSRGYFKLNAISELEDIDGKKPLDFIISKADKLKLLKESTPSKFGSGRVNNPNTDQKNVTGGQREGSYRDRLTASLQDAKEVD
jgi:hypothetical protein|nr:MAG TPA: hypothetical protein [Caudoviricetes sp.]